MSDRHLTDGGGSLQSILAPTSPDSSRSMSKRDMERGSGSSQPEMRLKVLKSLLVNSAVMTVVFTLFTITLLSIAGGAQIFKAMTFKEMTCNVYNTTRITKINTTDCSRLNEGLLSPVYDSDFYNSFPIMNPQPTVCYQGVYNVSLNGDRKHSVQGPWVHSLQCTIRYLQAITQRQNVSCFIDTDNNIIWTSPPSSPYAIALFAVVCSLTVISMVLLGFTFYKVKYQAYLEEETPLINSGNNRFNRDFSFRR
ncbi:hypothetical protein SAMD00019534_098790 [Acytostelium subglobosum LB1]|uniref:hypothetical protein n=1 Tax=Acytostelium subglobosum LB1 TaxID=1410327 RepID=UPI000644F187|nr:hypothetical protein SAMD00019534_098790 [Acytostelium subglobosum LB1]GAM26704.1 hypothetical protein SAMD00019534_098790 [Acytostelium subglobosum LB1]|eukprot:XP_012750365.1 hypothetical protein SAMD00019534_098790 [Acytostelium subglobosum LB1]